MEILKEKFSSSMPNWLKTFIIKDSDVKDWFLRRGYDLSKISMTFYEVPKSSWDKIKNVEDNPEKILFLHLTGQDENGADKESLLICEPGWNNTWLKSAYPSIYVYKKRDDAFVHSTLCPWSDLFKSCLDMCYFDTSAQENAFGSINNKRDSRANNRISPSDFAPTMRYNKDLQKDLITSRSITGFDKSGYAILNPKELKARLNKKFPGVLGKKVIERSMKKVDDCYESLNEIISYIQTFMLKNPDWDAETIADVLQEVSRLQTSYDEICAMLEEDPTYYERYINQKIDRMFEIIENLKNNDLFVNNSRARRVYVDWDDDDKWIDDYEDT